ncbi:MAG: RHS repeat-associated core domain-containing protein, partial [Micrococcales bacterium]
MTVVLTASMLGFGFTPAQAATDSALYTASDDVSARTKAIALQHRVEVLGDLTSTETVWAEPDGSFTADVSSAPVRVQDSSSATGWRDLDLSLVASIDGRFRPVSGLWPVSFNGGGTASEVASSGLVSITTDSGSVIELGWDGALPVPVVSGSTVLYQDVRPGVDLKLVLTVTGFEEFFIIKQRPVNGLASLGLPVTVPNLVTAVNPDGSVSLSDAGTDVASVDTAYMWDATKNALTGEPANYLKVATSVDQAPGSDTDTVLLDANNQFLNDPNTVYPVVVDPAITLAPSSDTYVRSGSPTTVFQSLNPGTLQVGTQNSGGSVARSFLTFPTAGWSGTAIKSATLNLWQSSATTCTPSTLYVYPSDPSTDATTWNTQPAISNTAVYSTITASAGHDSTCPAAWLNIDVTNVVSYQASMALSGAAGFELKASETLNTSWKTFNSVDAASNKPSLTINFDHLPGQAANPSLTPGGFQSGVDYSSDLQPTLVSNATDVDGDTVQVTFNVMTSDFLPQSYLVASCSSPVVASGALASCKLPSKLSEGSTYFVRAMASNSAGSGSWSAFTKFTVTNAPPQTPTITCSYGNKGWQSIVYASNSCTISIASSMAASAAQTLQYTLDAGKPVTYTGLAGAAKSVTISIPSTAMLHTVTATTFSGSGISQTSTYQSGFGGAYISSPATVSRTSDTIRVDAVAPPRASTSTTVTASLWWRRAKATGTTWTAGPSNIPVTVGTTSEFVSLSNYVWSTQTATTDMSTTPSVDMPLNTVTNLDLQVCFQYVTNGVTSSNCSSNDNYQTVTIQRVPHAYGGNYPTIDAGPASVALLTGEATINQTDVSVQTGLGGLSVSRSFQSYLATQNQISGINQVFGPGWLASFDSPGFAAAEIIDTTNRDGHLNLTSSDGTTLNFTTPNGLVSQDPAGTYVLTGSETVTNASLTVSNTTPKLLTLTEQDGTVTVWKQANSVWVPQTVTEPGTSHTTSYTINPAGQVARILAPVAGGISCTTMVAGCSALNISYSSSTAIATNGLWNIAGQVSGISYQSWDPTLNAINTVGQEAYYYNADKTLADAINTVTNRDIKYTYSPITAQDRQTRILSYTPTGLAGYFFNYSSDASHQLLSVTRTPATGSGTPVTLASFVYDVSVATPPAGFPNLATATSSPWLQASNPTYSVAVFGADHTPTGSTAASLTANDAHYAHLYYVDAKGNTVNTANPGKTTPWMFTATDFNENNQPIRSFTPQAIQALQSFTANNQTMSQAFIDSYATITKYNDTYTVSGVTVNAGSHITDQWQPISTLGATTRIHTSYSYDLNAPNGGVYTVNPDNPVKLAYQLVTGVSVGETNALTGSSKSGYQIPADTKTITQTVYGYDPVSGTVSGWSLGKPTTVTTGLTGETITHKTVYDADGNTVETIAPQSTAGTGDYGDIRNIYYTAGTNPQNTACGMHPEWVGYLCWTGSLNAVTDGVAPATINTSYDFYGKLTLQTETSGTVTRTTTNSYDALSQLTSATTTVTGITTPTITRSYTYDPAGAVKTISGPAGSITYAYDAWGRQTSYLNQLGDTATTTYVPYGQTGAGLVQTFTDPAATISYSYGGTDLTGATEYRNLATQETITGVASYQASYDDNGQTSQVNAPNQVTETFGYNYRGQTINQNYASTFSGGQWNAGWSRQYNTAGQVIYESAPNASSNTQPNWFNRAYSYDSNGRLTQSQDWLLGGCQTRQYGYDANGDRVSKTIAQDATGNCATTNPVTTTHSFDLASRITNTGTGAYVYDQLGRETSIPATDTPNGSAATLTYNADDSIQAITSNGSTTTYSQDPAGRISLETAITTATGAVTSQLVKHYTDNSQAPSWTTPVGATDLSKATKYLPGLGSFTITSDNTTGNTLQVNDIHGDTVSSITLNTANQAVSLNALTVYDEFGNQEAVIPSQNQTATQTSTNTIKYGWAGQAEKATTLSGLILMGARVYNSLMGRFTSRDPVPGGNENAYSYPNDPINSNDWTGSWGVEDYVDLALLGLAFTPLAPIADALILIREAQVTYEALSLVVEISNAANETNAVNIGIKTGAQSSKILNKAGEIWEGFSHNPVKG